ncbi:MAG: hypothetical protein ACXWQ5_24235, partial [Ktedonobacterales bacterium]
GTKNMLRYGAPGIVDGGCAALTGELERRIHESERSDLRLQHDVLAIEHEAGAVSGVRVRDRQTGDETLLLAPLVISNVGPEATNRLLASEMPALATAAAMAGAAPATAPDSTFDLSTGTSTSAAHAPSIHEHGALSVAPSGKREASGLKVHLLSDESIIPHKGIMYCLDTERIAGIVQPSNSDRRLAPPGKHLLITHQLMRSDDVNAERDAARADLRRLFGERFGDSITILTMSQYRGEWPVNRAVQGADVSPQTMLDGLYLVGDAVKPSGYLMVEGVAQSVNALLDVLDGPLPSAAPAQRHTPPKPSSRRAFHWLVAPPPSHPGSQRTH